MLINFLIFSRSTLRNPKEMYLAGKLNFVTLGKNEKNMMLNDNTHRVIIIKKSF